MRQTHAHDSLHAADGYKDLADRDADGIEQGENGQQAKGGQHRQPTLAQRQPDELRRDQHQPPAQQKAAPHQQSIGAEEGL